MRIELKEKLIEIELMVLSQELKMALECDDLDRVSDLSENLERLSTFDEDYQDYLYETHITNLEISEDQLISGNF